MGFLDKPIGELTQADLIRLIEQTIERKVPPIPARLAALGDSDVPLIPPPAPEQDEALTWDDATGGFVYNTIDATFVSDGGTPGAITVALRQGPGWLQATWGTPTGTDDVLYYKVFLRPSAAPTTADATYLIATTPATSYVLHQDVGGSPLESGTTYHVKVVGFSAASGLESAASNDATGTIGEVDGSTLTISNINASEITTGTLDAARIAVGSLDGSVITADTITANELAAESVTAEKLEAVLELVSTIVAGTPGAARLELGNLTDSVVGLKAYATDGTTTTFYIDAPTGDVYINGRIDFGTGSRLTSEDMIELAQQSTASFQTGALVQYITARATSATSISTSWVAPTTSGNLLLMAVSIYDADGSPPTPTTPAGWTLVGNQSNSTARTLLYKIENAASHSGSQAITLNDTVNVVYTLLEYSGVQVQDVTTTNSGNSAAPSSGTTGATTQNDEIAFAVIQTLGAVGHDVESAGEISGWTMASNAPDIFTVPTTAKTYQTTYHKVLTTTGTQVATGAISYTGDWVGVIVTFKSKAVGVATPDADKVRIYAKDDLTGSGVTSLFVMDDNGHEYNLLAPPAVDMLAYQKIVELSSISVIPRYQNVPLWMLDNDQSLTLTNQRVTLTAIYVPKTTVLTGVTWFQVVQGAYTANNNTKVALYSFDGSTFTRVAQSSTDTALFKPAANTINSKAFSGTYTAVPGLYYIATLWCRSAITTVPELIITNTTGAPTSINNPFLTTTFFRNGYLDSQTDMPSTITPPVTGINAQEIWVGVY